jgi:hypothetical protein
MMFWVRMGWMSMMMGMIGFERRLVGDKACMRETDE